MTLPAKKLRNRSGIVKPANWPAQERLKLAAQFAKDLRDAKSDHPWTTLECGLLSELCEVLGVENQS